ncbi:hypothetical protein BD410DRAFT_88649 [Rickenella mellea]|uniref:C3H1-type domain-containing protein n=1 Tax=Rickenella mellea TaxID=50990 RepID=A0A4Y7QAG4_9AGAM|nr:hypothetical protein BD410DRAFT_88649 [Rickenella mellea]
MPPTPFCREALANGSCNQEGCTYRHDVLRCETCDIIIRSYHWTEHVKGRRHVTMGDPRLGVLPRTTAINPVWRIKRLLRDC